VETGILQTDRERGSSIHRSGTRFRRPLILAVMINESDMNRESLPHRPESGQAVREGAAGLMGIRCIVDKQAHCGERQCARNALV